MKSIPMNISRVPNPRYLKSASLKRNQLKRTLNSMLLLLTATIYAAVDTEMARE
jgi:hypothetical protein